MVVQSADWFQRSLYEESILLCRCAKQRASRLGGVAVCRMLVFGLRLWVCSPGTPIWQWRLTWLGPILLSGEVWACAGVFSLLTVLARVSPVLADRHAEFGRVCTYSRWVFVFDQTKLS